jgi:hypothetical protein
MMKTSNFDNSDDFKIDSASLANLYKMRTQLKQMNADQCRDAYVILARITDDYGKKILQRNELLRECALALEKGATQIRLLRDKNKKVTEHAVTAIKRLEKERDAYKNAYNACVDFIIDSENEDG